MKRTLFFLLALIMSVCAFGSKDVVPSDVVLADYYDQGNVCVCIFVPADMACNDFVLTGSFNGWSSTASACQRFEPVEGYDGWYVTSFEPEAEPDAEKGIQAKPIMLDVDGNFNWDYQVGAATVIRGGVQVVQGAFAGEIDLLNYGTDAPNVYTVDAWKKNPCTAIYHTYTITVISDGCDGLVMPYLIGGMTGWNFQKMLLDVDKTMEYQVPTYYITFKSAEGTPYQILSGLMDAATGDVEVEPSWSDDAYMQALVDGEWVRLPGEEDETNQLTHEDANIVWDLRSEELRWARCAPAEPEEYTIVGVKLPSLNSPEGVDIIGSFDGWLGTSMELLNTGWWFVQLNAKASDFFKFRSAGTWDQELEIYNAETDEWMPILDNQLVFGNLWSDDTWKGDPCKWIELDLSDPEIYRWTCPDCASTFTLTVSCDPNQGYVTGGGVYSAGSTVKVWAHPYTGYRFAQWSDGNKDNPRTVELTQDLSLRAEFVSYLEYAKIDDLYYILNKDEKTAGVAGVAKNSGEYVDWTTLPQEYVAKAVCPQDAAYLGLKNVQVYADNTYINILVEYDPDEIPDRTSVPFHVILNTDNSDATGGGGLWFTDPNADILLEGFLFWDNEGNGFGEPCPYNPSVFAYTGAVGSDEWNWENVVPASEHFCDSRHLAGNKVEIRLNRELIPATWNSDKFGIGFDIQQQWDAVGILPLGSPTEANPTGRTHKLQVKINHADVPGSEAGDYTNIIIPEKVTYEGQKYDVICIENYAFNNNKELLSIVVPESVVLVGNDVFGGCDNLVSYEGPAFILNFIYNYNLEVITINSGIINEFYAITRNPLRKLYLGGALNTELPSYALNGLMNLEELVLPAQLQEIGYLAVAGSMNLKKVVIPGSTVEIGNRAFEDCRSLEEVIFDGTGLKRIGDWAFYNCHELASINLPEGLMEIGKAAFYGCTYLQQVYMPASVQAIGDNAFALCSKIERMDVDALLPPTVAAKTFFEVSREAPVYVPDESIDLYKADAVWGELNIVGKKAHQAIDNTAVDSNVIKRVVNGQLLILRGDKTYTVTGQEVK